MDLRAYYIQAAEAAAPAVHADDDDDDDDVVEITSTAVMLKLPVQAGTVAGVAAVSRKGGGLPSLGLGVGDAESRKVVTNGGSGSRDLTCPECGKAFLSDKAMYGHLRSHPERGYKGANRPATAMNMPAAGEKQQRREEDALWKKWPVTAKRGRVASSAPSAGSAPAAAVPSSSSWRSEEEEAAMILLEMASRSTATEFQRRVRDAKHQIPDVEEDEEPMLHDHRHVAKDQMPRLMPQLMIPPDHNVACHVKVAPQQTPEAAGQQIVQPVLSPEVVIVDSQTPPGDLELVEIPTKDLVVVVRDNKQGAKKQKTKRRLQDTEQAPTGTAASPEAAANVKPPVTCIRIPSPASDRRHECLTCGKSFPTHQALGGHMSGHNKGGSGRHGHGGARFDDSAMAKVMQNILAHRNQRSSTVIIGGSTGAADGTVNIVSHGHEPGVASAGLEAGVAGAGQVRDVTGSRHEVGVAVAGQVRAVTGSRHEASVASAGLETGVAGAGQVRDVTGSRHEVSVAVAGQVRAVTGSRHEVGVAVAGQGGAVVAAVDQERHDVQSPAAAPVEQSPAPHVCPDCGMTFRSGQALGGHKRKHWYPEKRQARAAAVRSFDLNELPSEAEEGENQQP